MAKNLKTSIEAECDRCGGEENGEVAVTERTLPGWESSASLQFSGMVFASYSDLCPACVQEIQDVFEDA
jgi:hypothetical protein